jgi:nitrile hydratase accessory protein
LSRPDTPPFDAPVFDAPVFDAPVFDAPIFDAPWQAQVFALAVGLNEAGVFSWTDWAATFSDVIAREQAPEAPSNDEYYRCWLIALEQMLTARGLADAETVGAVTQAWHRAAQATPHGAPILLANDPYSSGLGASS